MFMNKKLSNIVLELILFLIFINLCNNNLGECCSCRLNKNSEYQSGSKDALKKIGKGGGVSIKNIQQSSNTNNNKNSHSKNKKTTNYYSNTNKKGLNTDKKGLSPINEENIQYNQNEEEEEENNQNNLEENINENENENENIDENNENKNENENEEENNQNNLEENINENENEEEEEKNTNNKNNQEENTNENNENNLEEENNQEENGNGNENENINESNLNEKEKEENISKDNQEEEKEKEEEKKEENTNNQDNKENINKNSQKEEKKENNQNNQEENTNGNNKNEEEKEDEEKNTNNKNNQEENTNESNLNEEEKQEENIDENSQNEYNQEKPAPIPNTEIKIGDKIELEEFGFVAELYSETCVKLYVKGSDKYFGIININNINEFKKNTLKTKDVQMIYIGNGKQCLSFNDLKKYSPEKTDWIIKIISTISHILGLNQQCHFIVFGTNDKTYCTYDLYNIYSFEIKYLNLTNCTEFLYAKPVKRNSNEDELQKYYITFFVTNNEEHFGTFYLEDNSKIKLVTNDEYSKSIDEIKKILEQ